MCSNEPGVFTFILESNLSGSAMRLASEDLHMEKLLEAKYEKRSAIGLFKGQAKFDLELLLYQINKKYVNTFLASLLIPSQVLCIMTSHDLINFPGIS